MIEKCKSGSCCLLCEYNCITMVRKGLWYILDKCTGDGFMEEKLQITRKRFSGESTVISLRLPKDMLEEIDKIAAFTGRPRNELLTTAIEFAIKHMEIEQEDK